MIFELENVWVKGKNGNFILKDINFSMDRGELVALIGRNGAGKTTLIKTMIGELKPVKGTVKFKGKPINPSTIFKEVGVVLQNPDHQLFSFSVRDEIKFVLNNYNLNPDVDYWLNKFNLSHLADKHPFWLSEGEKKKVCIVSVLCHNPSTLILDEPFSTLDWFERREMLKLIETLNKEGHTILLTTHDFNLLKKFKRVVYMENGQIKCEGSWNKIRKVLNL